MNERMSGEPGEVRGSARPIVNGATLSATGMAAMLMIFFSVMQMGSWARELYGALGPNVLVFRGDYLYAHDRRDAVDHWDAHDRRHVHDYQYMIDVAGQLDHVSEVFVSYALNPRHSVREASIARLREDVEVEEIKGEVAVKGVDALYAKFRAYRMQAGRFLEQGDKFGDVAVISEQFAEEVDARIGDRLRLEGREFAIAGIVARRKLLGVSSKMWEDVFLPVEPYRQIAAIEAERRVMRLPRSRPWIRVYLVFTPGTQRSISHQLETLLDASKGPGNIHFIGQARTAYGYTDYLVPAWGAGLMLLAALCLWGYARSSTAFFSAYPFDERPARAMRQLLAASGIGGVVTGSVLSGLMVELHELPVTPALLSLAIALPIQFLVARRTLRRLRS